MEQSDDSWWIIGNAAVALHGGEPAAIADIDVITSKRDLETLYQTLPLTNTPDGDKSLFVSDLFGRWSAPPMDVEFMVGLKLQVGQDWHPIQPQPREANRLSGHTLFAPEKEERIAILQRFGRSKDLPRAAMRRP